MIILNCSDIYAFLEETKKGNRQQFVLNMLDQFENVEEDIFIEHGVKFANYYIPSEIPSNKFIVAHYDVVNPNYCANDNSASIINMLVYRQQNPNINIALLDGEEPPYMGAGSRRLSDLINNNEFGEIDIILNLELTGVGRDIMTNTKRNKTHDLIHNYGAFERQLPFSDTDIFIGEGLDSEVLILIPKENGVLKEEIIHYCHNSRDNADLLNISDMEYFVDVTLPKIVNGEKK